MGVYSEKMKNEAINRLGILERNFGLNPNVRKYFIDNRLYYSYLTAGGFMGSIDTIQYDPRYEEIVRKFEKENGCLVYHVIESDNMLSLLFVSDNEDIWSDERPNTSGIKAHVVNINDKSSEDGYIKLDVLQGALRRRDNIVYESLEGRNNNSEDINTEVVERIKILEKCGMLTDLNVANIFLEEGDICFSKRMTLYGNDICIVNRISEIPQYEALKNWLERQLPDFSFYYMMVSDDNRLAFLFVSGDNNSWEYERENLYDSTALAYVIDINDKTVSSEEIYFEMISGGPFFVDTV